MQSDPDIQAFVERLEQAAESEEQSAAEDVPSGDMLAREFQRFLRQRGPRGGIAALRRAQRSAAGQTMR